jgi:predicted Zn-dependent protease
VRAAVFATLALTGCAPLFGGLTRSSTNAGDHPYVEQLRVQAAMQQARDTAAARCDGLLTREVPLAEELAVGRWYARADLRERQVLDATGANAELARTVATVGKLLAVRSSRPGLPWTFGVIVDPQARALHTPGGNVFVTTGLLARVKNEAQLAGVLAHELVHVTRRHPLEGWKKALHARCAVAVTARALLDAKLDAGPQTADDARFADAFRELRDFDLETKDGAFLTFVFDAAVQLYRAAGSPLADELEADGEAARLVAFTGYDPAEYERFLAAGALPGQPPPEARLEPLRQLREGELGPFVHPVAGRPLPAFAP